MKIKAQSSMEFLMVFGIGLSLILIIGGLFVSYTNTAKNTFDKRQLEAVGEEVLDYVNRVYFLGEGNRITSNLKLPSGIENLTITHINNSVGEFDVLNFTYYSAGMLQSSYFSSAENYIRFNCTKCYHTPNLNGNWSSYYNSSMYNGGSKKIRIESRGEWVSIDFIQE